MIPNVLMDFDQTKVMAAKAPVSMAASVGACHNFSIHWVSLMYKDLGAHDLPHAKARIAALTAAKGEANRILQKIFLDENIVEDMAEADKLMIGLRGLKLGKDPGWAYSAYDENKLIALLKAPKECGMVYSFWFPPGPKYANGGSHSIAFFRNAKPSKGKLVPVDDVLSALEPNFGECEIAEANIGKWIAALKKEYGNFTNHWMRILLPNK